MKPRSRRRRELLGELPPAEAEPPRRRMHLVDRERPRRAGRGAAPLEPLVVGPLVARAGRRRGGLRRHLGGERERVGLEAQLAVGAVHLELVLVALGRLGHERGPDAGRALRLERVRAAVPAVPVADDGRHRVRSAPRRRSETPSSVDVRAELLVDPLVTPLAGEMEIELAEPCSGVERSASPSDLRLQHPQDPGDRDPDPVGPVVRARSAARRPPSRARRPSAAARSLVAGAAAATARPRRGSRRGTPPGTAPPSPRAARRRAGAARPRLRTRTSAACRRRRAAASVLRRRSGTRARGLALEVEDEPVVVVGPERLAEVVVAVVRMTRPTLPMLVSSRSRSRTSSPRPAIGSSAGESGSEVKTCSISSSIEAESSASDSELGSSGAKCGSAGSEASALCSSAVTSPSRRACSGQPVRARTASVSRASSQPSPRAGRRPAGSRASPRAAGPRSST